MGAGPLGSRGYRLWSLYCFIGTPERTREGVPKSAMEMPQLWKSAKDADSHSCLENSPQKTLRVSHIPTAPAAKYLSFQEPNQKNRQTQHSLYSPKKADVRTMKYLTWVEPAVWTTRMLTALENGSEGGKWFSLIDKVYTEANLKAAFARVKANKGAAGIDHHTIERYEKTWKRICNGWGGT